MHVPARSTRRRHAAADRAGPDRPAARPAVPRASELTGTQASVLATVARRGPLRHQRAGRARGHQPDDALPDRRQAGAGRPAAPPPRPGRRAGGPRRAHRRPAPSCNRRQRAERTRLLGERLAALPGPPHAAAGCWPRCRPWKRWPTSSRDAPQWTTAGHMSPATAAPPDLRRAGQPQLPALVRRPVGLAGRHLDADDRPVLAGPGAHRLRHRDRAGRRAADAADAAARARTPAWSRTGWTSAG